MSTWRLTEDDVMVYLWLWCPACVCRRSAPSCRSSPQPGSTAPKERWIWRWLLFCSLSGCPEITVNTDRWGLNTDKQDVWLRNTKVLWKRLILLQIEVLINISSDFFEVFPLDFGCSFSFFFCPLLVIDYGNIFIHLKMRSGNTGGQGK